MNDPTQRLDQWLWHARFFKTRGLATKLVAGGHVRVDGDRVSKPAHALRPGVTLTFPQARRIRVIRVSKEREGPRGKIVAMRFLTVAHRLIDGMGRDTSPPLRIERRP